MRNSPFQDAPSDGLWYTRPAETFEEGMPIGNGRLGAMIYGRPWRKEDYFSERILLNDETLWYGGPVVRNNPDARKTLPEVRKLLAQGRVAEAEYLADRGLTGTPRNGTPYQALGELVFTSREDHLPVEGYRRELDLATGVATVRYNADGLEFEAQAFASAPANVLAFRFRARGKRRLNFHAYLRRRPFDGAVLRRDGLVGILGQAGPGGVKFAAAMARRDEEGGHILGQSLCFDDAETATIYVAAASDFRGESPETACAERLRAALSRDHEALHEEHVADFRRLYVRVWVRLGDAGDLPTDERLRRVREGAADPALQALQFQFARYLTISSSRPGSLPMTLQGIWCESMTPIWNSNYTINVNLQMSYWAAEAAALPECHLPLFGFLERLVENGRQTARNMYGCRGFVAHHTSNLWAETAPTGGVYGAGLWPLGGAWLALHAWEHFLFGGDEDFLRSCGYPILREAALFFCDYLTPNERGEQVASPSVSPENWFLLPDGTKGKMGAGVAMDDQVVGELFSAAITAAERLGVDETLRTEWTRLRHALPPIRINRHGAIQEWHEDYDEADPGHRHVSHLFALHPGTQIDPGTTPDLAAAAARTLQRRLSFESDRTGWSLAWMANHFARLGDGEAAQRCLRRVLEEFTFPSLMTACPPFNLDANFGVCSAFLEMLLQSHRGELHLLPALPAAWSWGEISGLRSRGGFTVSFAWQTGRLKCVEISATRAGGCVLRTNVPIRAAEGTWTSRGDGAYYLTSGVLEAGETACFQALETGG
jgi:alpha-L-fucosidase 2